MRRGLTYTWNGTVGGVAQREGNGRGDGANGRRDER